MTATCAVCGQTEIRKRKGNRSAVYICATKKWAYATEYRRAHAQQHPRTYGPDAHALSNVDEEKKTAVCSRCGPVQMGVWRSGRSTIRRCSIASRQDAIQAWRKRQRANHLFINQYKVKQGCQRCGARKSARGLRLYRRDNGREVKAMATLQSYSRERLTQELKRYDVLCTACRPPYAP